MYYYYNDLRPLSIPFPVDIVSFTNPNVLFRHYLNQRAIYCIEMQFRRDLPWLIHFNLICLARFPVQRLLISGTVGQYVVYSFVQLAEITLPRPDAVGDLLFLPGSAEPMVANLACMR